jgi:hypothetical protein
MAKIKINDIKSIKPAGADLFADDEGFLNELNSDELSMIAGGLADSGVIITFYCPIKARQVAALGVNVVVGKGEGHIAA